MQDLPEIKAIRKLDDLGFAIKHEETKAFFNTITTAPVQYFLAGFLCEDRSLPLDQQIVLKEFYNHHMRLGVAAFELALQNNFSHENAYTVGYAAVFHDIGKLDVDIKILAKRNITQEEFELIKNHVEESINRLKSENGKEQTGKIDDFDFDLVINIIGKQHQWKKCRSRKNFGK